MKVIGYKCFNKDLINHYGQKFEIGKIYIASGIIKFGTRGNGFHMCKNIEDCFRFFDTFRAEAAGRISRELRIKSPTLEIVNVTTTAMATVKIVCAKPTGMPREAASCGWMAVRVSRLAQRIQKSKISTKTSARLPSSLGVTERISPIKY